jgi:formiminoglutamate deiminase
MALAGYTLVGEFHYLHHDVGGRPYADANAMGSALVQAAADAGVRLTLLDTVYLAGGLQGDGHVPLDEVQQRFSDGSVAAWEKRLADQVDTPLARHGAAVHSVRAVPRDALAEVAQAVGERPVHAHVSEQPAENLAAQMHYGRTPTQLLADAGLVGSRLTAVHATHLGDDDIRLLGEAAATACVCPTTERDLADGIGEARRLVDAGCTISLGSDQHAVIDPFEEMRGLEMHERLVSSERGRFSCGALLRAGSSAGYASLGWPEGGRIEAGALADFVVLRDESVRVAGSRASQVVMAATAADVDFVVVGGQEIVRHGQHGGGPVAPRLLEAFERLREQA